MYNYQKLLNPHEKVFFFGGMHWIVMAGSFAMMLIMTWAGLKIDNLMHDRHGYPYAADFATGGAEFVVNNIWSWMAYIPWVFIAIGVAWVMGDAIRYLSTKVLLTSHRIIVKTGWIMVDIKEVEMEEIRAAHIDQMLFGRIFGYGKVYLDSRFVGDSTLPLMARPFELMKLIHTIRDNYIAEQEEIAHPISSEELPFMHVKGEVHESTMDEIPEVQMHQPAGVEKSISEAEKKERYKQARSYGEDVDFLKENASSQGATGEQKIQEDAAPKEAGDKTPELTPEDIEFLHELKEKKAHANENKAA